MRQKRTSSLSGSGSGGTVSSSSSSTSTTSSSTSAVHEAVELQGNTWQWGRTAEEREEIGERIFEAVQSRSIIGPEVGIEEFWKNFTRISREFDRKLHVFLIISIRNSYEIPEPILNAHFGHRHKPNIPRCGRYFDITSGGCGR
jgi:hypothetical protein